MNGSNQIFPSGDRRLKFILINLVKSNEVNNANYHESLILLGELGQRIATLLKYVKYFYVIKNFC